MVFEATELTLDRRVAIKFLVSSEAIDCDVDRFRHEAKTLARLSHPNVVDIYRLGEYQGAPYLVMQWLDGLPVSDLIDQHPNGLELGLALSLFKQAARGLGAAHERGVIHRDVKPANMILPRQAGVLKVIDFGLAKVPSETLELTLVGAVMGTPSYSAPEQLDGTQVDERSDIYALALTVYEMVTGQRAFDGSSLMKVLYAQCNKPLPSLRDRVPSAPVELDALLQEMGAKSPDQRPVSMAQVLDRLTEIEAAGRSRGQGRRTSTWGRGRDLPTADALQTTLDERATVPTRPDSTTGRACPAKRNKQGYYADQFSRRASSGRLPPIDERDQATHSVRQPADRAGPNAKSALWLSGHETRGGQQYGAERSTRRANGPARAINSDIARWRARRERNPHIRALPRGQNIAVQLCIGGQDASDQDCLPHLDRVGAP